MFAKTATFRFIVFVIAVLFVLGTGTCLCEAQEADKQDSAVGELKLEGGSVERLVLRRNDGHTERFEQPAETIELPEGQYHLLESHLKGNYACFQGGTDVAWVAVAKGKPAVLKVGAPLKQTLKVKRRGKALVLDYKLLGLGGEIYSNQDRSKPPSFAVYKGDKEIASDKFQYG